MAAPVTGATPAGTARCGSVAAAGEAAGEAAGDAAGDAAWSNTGATTSASAAPDTTGAGTATEVDDCTAGVVGGGVVELAGTAAAVVDTAGTDGAVVVTGGVVVEVVEVVEVVGVVDVVDVVVGVGSATVNPADRTPASQVTVTSKSPGVSPGDNSNVGPTKPTPPVNGFPPGCCTPHSNGDPGVQPPTVT